MTTIDPSPGIPASLAPFFPEAPIFPEYALNALDLERSAATIIKRVLQCGNRAEIHWLFSVYPAQKVTQWVWQWGIYALLEPNDVLEVGS